MKTKSKNDLAVQINRIYANFGNHQLYNRALNLVYGYNWRMSETAYNNRLHSIYMKVSIKPGKEKLRAALLERMRTAQYTRAIYAGY